MPVITATYVAATPPRRHDHRVRAMSADFDRLRRLDHLLVDEGGARVVVEAVCGQAGVPTPKLKFHVRRSPFTGATEAPRSLMLELAKANGGIPAHGYAKVPVHGALRLGRTASLMTIAHEIGHHLVFHLDPPSTPNHGNLWVSRFDEAAAVIAPFIES